MYERTYNNYISYKNAFKQLLRELILVYLVLLHIIF